METSFIAFKNHLDMSATTFIFEPNLLCITCSATPPSVRPVPSSYDQGGCVDMVIVPHVILTRPLQCLVELIHKADVVRLLSPQGPASSSSPYRKGVKKLVKFDLESFSSSLNTLISPFAGL